MSIPHQSDFEIGYNYARDRYGTGIAVYNPEYFFELGKAFLHGKGSIAELSRGMGFYYLQMGMQMLLLKDRQKYHERLQQYIRLLETNLNGRGKGERGF